MQFGLLGAVVGAVVGDAIDKSNEAKHQKAAEALIAPIRADLASIDVDALVLNTTKTALANVSWLSTAPVTIEKTDSAKAESAFIDSNDASQVVLIHYSYFFDDVYETMQLKVTIEIARKIVAPGANADDRFSTKYLAYQQTIEVYVPLPTAKHNNDWANSSAWAASNGDLARKALRRAFDAATTYIPRALNLTDAEINDMYNRKNPKMNYGDNNEWGRRIEDSSNNTFIWDGKFIIVTHLI